MSRGPWKRGPRLCSEPGCTGLHSARGLCFFHYQREYRAGRFTGMRAEVADLETPDPDEPTDAEIVEARRRMAEMRRLKAAS